jgi:uncharacterized protein (DUF1501 family)
MLRRQVLRHAAAWAGAPALLGATGPIWAQSLAQRAASRADRVLVLVELKGGNDGLNTVVPYADDAYYRLRESIAIPRDTVRALDAHVGLHPELRELLPLWEKGELAVVQGVGYPQPNLSHFRSIEIWDTASHANEYLADGWVARAMQAGLGERANFTCQGVLIGGGDAGVLAGARAIRLNDPDAFVNQAALVVPRRIEGNPALQHLLRLEGDVYWAAEGLRAPRHEFQTPFPPGTFGNALRAAVQVVASQRGRAGVPVLVVSLGSFDTHQNQLPQHANLLRQLGAGMAALRSALTELQAWDRTLVMTFSEFGRRARQNGSNGTDHGTAAPHFVAGGAVRGGLWGQAPDLQLLDDHQNLRHGTDFRQLFATVARDWWGLDPRRVLRGDFEPIPLLRE